MLIQAIKSNKNSLTICARSLDRYVVGVGGFVGTDNETYCATAGQDRQVHCATIAAALVLLRYRVLVHRIHLRRRWLALLLFVHPLLYRFGFVVAVRFLPQLEHLRR